MAEEEVQTEEEKPTQDEVQQDDTVDNEPMFIGEKDLDLGVVLDVPVEITVVLGEKEMFITDLLNLGTGSVVELERKVGEPVDIYVNKRLVARGEVVIVDDHIGVTMTEIIKKDSA